VVALGGPQIPDTNTFLWHKFKTTTVAAQSNQHWERSGDMYPFEADGELVIGLGGGGGGGRAAGKKSSATLVNVDRLRCSDPPQASELGDWDQQTYEMDARVAAKLGFTGFGGMSTNGHQKVTVLEFSRSSTCDAPNGEALRYGVAVRLSVKATNLEANANLSLPFLAVETQAGRVQTSSKLTVNGYVGSDLAPLIPAPDIFSIERYVDLMKRVGQIQELISQKIDNIRPVLLTVPEEVADPESEAEQAIGVVWALARLADGKSLDEAKRDFPKRESGPSEAAMESTFDLAGSQPGVSARDWARKRIEGFEFKRR